MKTLAMSAEGVRQAMLARVAIPEGMLTDALQKTHDKLNAKKTTFITRKGVVVAERETDDNEAQLRAAEQIYKLADLVGRDRSALPTAPAVQLEVDAVTGVIRLKVGGEQHGSLTPFGEEPTATEAWPGAAVPTAAALPPPAEQDEIEFIKAPRSRATRQTSETEVLLRSLNVL